MPSMTPTQVEILLSSLTLTPIDVESILAYLIKAGHLAVMAVAVDRAQHDGASADGYRDPRDVEAIEKVFVDLCDESYLPGRFSDSHNQALVESSLSRLLENLSRPPANPGELSAVDLIASRLGLGNPGGSVGAAYAVVRLSRLISEDRRRELLTHRSRRKKKGARRDYSRQVG